MDSINNPYSAPKSSVRGVSNDAGVTPVMGEILGSASIWARIISVINWIAFGFIALAVIALLISLMAMFSKTNGSSLAIFAFAFFISLFVGGFALMYWHYARSMGRYASAAKQLRERTDEDDIAICFSSSSTFMKVTIIVNVISLIMVVLSIVLALLLPGYEDFLRASQF